MQNMFFTADMHFGHTNIIKYCSRPFENTDEMNHIIIENWNNVVKDNDLVYVLGDFCFHSHPNQFSKVLKGKKVLIRGNHDRWSRKSKEIASSGFLEIHDTLMLKDKMLFLSHYGHRVWPNSHHGAGHLYGHSHGGLPPWGKSFDVGVDCNNFKPLSVEEIFEKMKFLDIKFK